MDLYRCGIKGNRACWPVHYYEFFLEPGVNPLQRPVFGPPADSHVNSMPGAERSRKGPPCTAVLTNVDQCLREYSSADFHVSARFREETNYLFFLFPGYFHHIENVVTQYSGVLSDGRTVIVSTEEHDRIVSHIREVDAINNKLYYSPNKGTYKMPPVETEIWRTYKGTVWTPKTQAVTKQRFVQTEDAKGKFSIGKTLFMTVLAGIGISFGPLTMDGEAVHPAIGFGSGFLASGLLNLLFQPVEFWDVEGVTVW
jgi:hypothetical protein